MNQVQAEHPSVEQLTSFSRGQLDDPSLSQIAEHLGRCESCSTTLNSLPEDRLTKLARAASRLGSSSLGGSQKDSQNSNENITANSEAIPTALASLDRYRVLERIGRGGMGDVFRAEHRLMQRMVALKVINQKLTENREAVTRFRNEVRAAAALSHPNIVSSYDAENVGDLHFLVMELVDGASLSQHVAEHGLPTIEQAVDFIEQASRGLEVAFENGMVHRDIKPQNLMLTNDGTVKILDFGLARFQRQQLAFESSSADTEGTVQALIQTSAGITGTNLAIGTPDYLAPEQARDATSADTRSDIYSLGGTLYFLLTGQPLFPDGNPLEKISQHLMGQPAKLSSIRSDVPTPVVSLMERMIEKDPDSRFQTPAELLDAINQVKTAIGMQTPVANTGSNRRLFIAAGLLGGFAILATAALILQPEKTTNVLVIAPTRAFYPDFETVRQELERRQVVMTTASVEKIIDPVSDILHEPFEADLLLSQAQVDQFDAIVIIGGHISQLTEGAASAELDRIISEARKSKIPLGGICLGVDVLRNCGVVEVRELVKNAKDERIGSFDGIITVVDTENTEAFMGRLLDW